MGQAWEKERVALSYITFFLNVRFACSRLESVKSQICLITTIAMVQLTHEEWQAASFRAALAHLDAGEFDQCIAKAKQNLADHTLSRYYRMQNLLLAAHAEDDWYVYSPPH